jgi:hypothetical protein
MIGQVSLPIPPEFSVLVVRTDFTDDVAWHEVCRLMETSDCEGFRPTLLRGEDRAYDGAAPVALLGNEGIGYAVMIDHRAITDPEHPVLVVDLNAVIGHSGQSFRALPGELAGIEANLGIANMDFDEFADAVDADGVFRGFTT